MEIKVYNLKGASSKTVTPTESIFNVKTVPDLVHQVVVGISANNRQVIAHTKDRGDVRGGGKKPWKQKGTGRARHGSIRSPIWKGGGVAFGPRSDRNFSQKINKKMKQQALSMVLTAKNKANELLVIDGFESFNKTKDMFNFVSNIIKNTLGESVSKKSILIATDHEENKNIQRVASNIPGISVLDARNLSAHDVLSNKYILFTVNAFDQINKVK